jgi:hypothetical protein
MGPKHKLCKALPGNSSEQPRLRTTSLGEGVGNSEQEMWGQEEAVKRTAVS